MSHPDYKHLSTAEDKVIEECSELIQAICKVKTFGWFSYHPDKPNRTNIDDVESEMADVIEAVERLDSVIRGIRFQRDAKEKLNTASVMMNQSYNIKRFKTLVISANAEQLEAQNKVMRAALEAECGDRCNAEYNPCSARQTLNMIDSLWQKDSE